MTGYVYRGHDIDSARPGASGPTATTKAGMIPVDRVTVHNHNIRRNLGDLRDLTESIRRHGILTPLLLEKRGETFRIRDGHRRFAAAKLAGLHHVPAVVHGRALDDGEWVVAAVQVNHHRRGMSGPDRRDAVLRLREDGLPWEQIAEEFAASVSTVRRWANDSPTVRATPSDRATYQAWVRARLAAANDWTPLEATT